MYDFSLDSVVNGNNLGVFSGPPQLTETSLKCEELSSLWHFRRSIQHDQETALEHSTTSLCARVWKGSRGHSEEGSGRMGDCSGAQLAALTDVNTEMLC